MKRSGTKVDFTVLLGAAGRIPRKVATCPECNRTLRYEVTAVDEDGIAEIDLHCGAPMKNRHGEWTHRFWQSDWQGVVDKCMAWVNANAPNEEIYRQKTLE